MPAKSIKIANFAHIKEINISFGDLTVIVGPQASGKSLAMQWVKLLADRNAVCSDLKKYGYYFEKNSEFYSLYFGEGYERSVTEDVNIIFNGEDASPLALPEKKVFAKKHKIRVIPAHRGLLMVDGWPKLFQQHAMDTPYVARRSSEDLYNQLTSMNTSETDVIFPRQNRLKSSVREIINQAVYHDSTLNLSKHSQRKRLELKIPDGSGIPFMNWTAGQREFTPLLLSLYDLMPAGKVKKHEDICTIIIEEPEMGLHSKAIESFLVLIVELIHRGYKVILTTHSSIFLDFAWGISQLKLSCATSADYCNALRIPIAMQDCIDTLKKSKIKIYNFDFGSDGRVKSHDITSLDPFAVSTHENTWGGLASYTKNIGDALYKINNRCE
ncbi:hypothetical protein DK842_18760 [Chromobacterium phragmitis]|uniref:AAA family ATPase n=1 Tax=Chromobacterium phragmitis TaxID=2202141 RepID=UPI000DED1BB7|nr:AAA family ATPase [Chromobacterium phragmitis]AXE31757.1 hypothetical protein DK842_18760 [Chromobacterium phragmitis]